MASIASGITLMLLGFYPVSGGTAPDSSWAQQRATTVQSDRDEGVANLPYARGRTFQSLDEYLAYLQQQGAIDLPWWREISPGVYEHVVRMTGAKRETATREELMRRFGFTH